MGQWKGGSAGGNQGEKVVASGQCEGWIEVGSRGKMRHHGIPSEYPNKTYGRYTRLEEGVKSGSFAWRIASVRGLEGLVGSASGGRSDNDPVRARPLVVTKWRAEGTPQSKCF